MLLVTAKEMQAIDRLTIASFGIPGRVLMENAGRGATRFLSRVIPDLDRKRVAVLAGRGNNGGDGFVIARYLFQRHIDVSVFLLAARKGVKQDDARANLELLASLGVPVVEVPEETAFQNIKASLEAYDLYVDAILGTGLTSDVRGYFKSVIEFINQSQKPIFAVDIPSGLNADTGKPRGVCVRAQATATFALAKTAHFQYPGAAYTGTLDVVDIGIPPHIIQEVAPFQTLITPKLMQTTLKARAKDAHKGQTGHLLVVAGSGGKTGAAALAAMSALRSGAGLVTLAVPESLNNVLEPMVIEAMSLGLPEGDRKGILSERALPTVLDNLSGMQCLALGPGVGTDAETKAFIQHLIPQIKVPLVIDADGINCLVDNSALLEHVRVPVVLTPHPGEMARLTGTSSVEVQKDRIRNARDFAKRYGVHVVLKGAGTVVAHPDGSIFINTTGNPGMASGGMGDVLTGVIAGLVTQGYAVPDATHMGVYLHGLAADQIAGGKGDIGYLASEVMAALPRALDSVLNTTQQDDHHYDG